MLIVLMSCDSNSSHNRAGIEKTREDIEEYYQICNKRSKLFDKLEETKTLRVKTVSSLEEAKTLDMKNKYSQLDSKLDKLIEDFEESLAFYDKKMELTYTLMIYRKSVKTIDKVKNYLALTKAKFKGDENLIKLYQFQKEWMFFGGKSLKRCSAK